MVDELEVRTLSNICCKLKILRMYLWCHFHAINHLSANLRHPHKKKGKIVKLQSWCLPENRSENLYISLQHNKLSECIIMLLPSYMPPEHDSTAIQHPSKPGKINWLTLHASVFRRKIGQVGRSNTWRSVWRLRCNGELLVVWQYLADFGGPQPPILSFQ